MDMGKMLFSENDLPYLKALGTKSIDDFLALRKNLQTAAELQKADILRTVTDMQELIASKGLESGDFLGGYLPKFLDKIGGGELHPDFKAKWKQNFDTAPLWRKNDSPVQKARLDTLRAELLPLFDRLREGMFGREFLLNALKNSAPFTVLGMLRLELEKLQKEEQLLPVAQFNSIISQELAEQPAPYIYERLGEKYRHYFIDEFQDTSLLQWKNLIPLIGNALQSEDEQGRRGSLILVGDAKQAIYRWRGGRAEQFIDLISGSASPFHLKADVLNLPTNYRSRAELVDFNNDFFGYLSAFLGREAHERLFRDSSRQLPNSGSGGLIGLEFLSADTEDFAAAYVSRVLTLLKELKSAEYTWGDICVLTRKRSEGVLISTGLIASGIPVLSSETLLLKNHPSVGFLISLLQYLQNQEDPNPQLDILLFLAPDSRDVHSWVQSRREKLYNFLVEDYGFDPAKVALMPVYEILELAIRQFALGGAANAYLIFLLDTAQEIGLKEDQAIETFLNIWERKQDNISLKAPEDLNAVRLMTIHKAKGLEFPIVIYPFADTAIYRERNPKLWAPIPAESFSGFPFIQISKRKEALQYSPKIAQRYLDEQENLELDALNVLYVAHTRAEDALFILSKIPKSASSESPQSYADWYQRYLMDKGVWEPDKFVYRFGSLPSESRERDRPEGIPLAFNPSQKDHLQLQMITRNGELWATEKGAALEFGNLIHYGMSLIRVPEDIPNALDRLMREGELPPEKRQETESLLTGIVHHPELRGSFQPGQEVLNERDIIAKNGVILRPDRIVLNGRQASLIDYKTGRPKPEHRAQLKSYVQTIAEMGYSIDKALLVYLKDKTITVDHL
jgi:ATP-dependent exoDNAse (exonuclease V) beta subunit